MKPDDLTYEAAIDYLFDRINYERIPHSTYTVKAFKLERMEDLLRRLGDPQQSLPAVHIAGTKGKGSTAVMAARMLEAAGYCVGLFTSPHIHRYEERMTINGVQPTAAEIVGLVEQLRSVVADMDERGPEWQPTFFEITTALGWLHFLQRECDIVVLEVGLGGRLDSTNICKPLVTVITSISRDHTRLLGSTLAEIAREKAGIIKEGVPVISGVVDIAARDVIAEICTDHHASFLELGEELCAFAGTGDTSPADRVLHQWTADVTTPLASYQQMKVPLPGQHQVDNLALAIAVIDHLRSAGWKIDIDSMRRGLANVRWPLRIEVVGHDPLVIIDSAHNDASMQALVETLASVYARRRVLVFATSRDKETHELLEIVAPHFDHIVLTQYRNNPRALAVADLAEIAAGVVNVACTTADGPEAAWTTANQLAEPDDLICVTGSFFIATEVKELIGPGS